MVRRVLAFFNEFFKDTTLLNGAQLVAVDRPGYGYSDFGRVKRRLFVRLNCCSLSLTDTGKHLI